LPDGSNVFALLNRWQGWWPDKPRYEFVVESLRQCFGFFGNLSFLPSGQFIEGWIVHRKYPGPGFPAAQSAEGWLVALLHFAAVASANAGDVVGIDSFENALHPRAVTKAVELIRDYAERKGISVVLTTQSPQVIDCFEAHPEQVFVLDPRDSPGPRRLKDMRTEEWLASFRLGSEFADGDFGWEPRE
jgi:predicted ATPase